MTKWGYRISTNRLTVSYQLYTSLNLDEDTGHIIMRSESWEKLEFEIGWTDETCIRKFRTFFACSEDWVLDIDKSVSVAEARNCIRPLMANVEVRTPARHYAPPKLLESLRNDVDEILKILNQDKIRSAVDKPLTHRERDKSARRNPSKKRHEWQERVVRLSHDIAGKLEKVQMLNDRRGS